MYWARSASYLFLVLVGSCYGSEVETLHKKMKKSFDVNPAGKQLKQAAERVNNWKDVIKSMPKSESTYTVFYGELIDQYKKYQETREECKKIFIEKYFYLLENHRIFSKKSIAQVVDNEKIAELNKIILQYQNMKYAENKMYKTQELHLSRAVHHATIVKKLKQSEECNYIENKHEELIATQKPEEAKILDYVFDKLYPLISLEDVSSENRIRDNLRLE